MRGVFPCVYICKVELNKDFSMFDLFLKQFLFFSQRET